MGGLGGGWRRMEVQLMLWFALDRRHRSSWDTHSGTHLLNTVETHTHLTNTLGECWSDTQLLFCSEQFSLLLNFRQRQRFREDLIWLSLVGLWSLQTEGGPVKQTLTLEGTWGRIYHGQGFSPLHLLLCTCKVIDIISYNIHSDFCVGV